MRVCFITHQATLEGAPRSVLDIIDHLSSEGVHINVIAPKDGPFTEALAKRSITCKLVRLPWWTASHGDPDDPGPTLQKMVAAGARVAEITKAWDVDVLYTNTSVTNAGAIAGMLTGKPHVWHIREFATHPDGIRFLLPFSTMARFADQTSNLILVNSQALHREWADWIAPQKLRVIDNYLPAPAQQDDSATLEVFDQRPELRDRFKIAIVGSIVGLKRQFDAVRAVAKRIEQGDDVCLLLAGPVRDQAYFDQIQRFIEVHKLQPRIHHVGYLAQPDALYRTSDVSLVCSTCETFGRVTIESMLQGTPVIGARGGGTAELIHDGVDGLLYEPGNVDDLAVKIGSLVADRELVANMAKAAPRSARRYSSIPDTIGPIHDLLVALQGQPNPAQPVGVVLSGPLSVLGRGPVRRFAAVRRMYRAAARMLKSKG